MSGLVAGEQGHAAARRTVADSGQTRPNAHQHQNQEGVDKLTLREGEEGTLRSFINTPNVGAADGNHRSWTKTGRRESGMGELVL